MCNIALTKKNEEKKRKNKNKNIDYVIINRQKREWRDKDLLFKSEHGKLLMVDILVAR